MKRKNQVYDMAYIAICAALITICSWISIPVAVPITMQTFAIFLTVLLLGGKRGTLSVLLYILLGAIGIPVFAGFQGGIGILLGNTGGYILGFLATGFIMWGMEAWLGNKLWVSILSMVLGLVACYTFGTIWFQLLYTQNSGPVGILTVLGWCVFPFIIPDILKIVLALILSKRLKKAVKIN